jgi:N-acetyldiaminopimelate deacetylase
MDLITVRRDLHKIPEIGFQEFKTQQYILELLQSIKTSYMHIHTWKTGVIVEIIGKNPVKKIGWRTDIDGLPIEEKTGLSFASIHPGAMHACGHDIHMTIALGVVNNLANTQPEQTVILYFQPAEEGPGGAEPLVKYLQSEQQALLADEIYALHIAPEYPVGTVATKEGLLFANTSELFIELNGLGGHAAFPHKTRDMSVAAAALLMQLQTIVSRSVDPLDSAVVTVGKMTSGTVQNIISDFAKLEGTIRTFSDATMQIVKQKIEAICKGIEVAYECEISIDYGSMYHEVNNNKESAEKLLALAATMDGVTPVTAPAAMTGEDFGYFLKSIKGAMFWAGASSEYGLHHAQLNPDEAMIPMMVQFVSTLLSE